MAAELLAGSLADLDLASVPLAGSDAATASAELAESLKPLESIPRTVTLASVTEDEGSDAPKTATAVYNTVWDVDASDTDWLHESHSRRPFARPAQLCSGPGVP